ADDRPVRQYFWSQDGRYVLYAQDTGGDEDYHVYAVDPAAEADAETGVPPGRDLTPLEGIRARITAVPEPTPDEILVGLNDRDPAWHDLYRVNIETGERELLLQNPGDIAGFEADLSGTPRLALRVDPQTGDTEIKRVVQDGDGFAIGETIYSCGVLETCGTIRFHPDGRRVYMRTNQGDRNLAELVLLDVETGETELVERDPEGEVDFAGVRFSNETDLPLITYYIGDRVRLYPKTDAFAADLDYLRETLPEGDIYPGSMSEDERYMLVLLTRDVDPGSRYLFDRETREVTLLYESRPELPTEHLAPMQVVRYEARDGLTIPAYLTLPKGVEPENLPTVINPHGGPWARDVFGYDATAQFLANRGYAVLQPNFRGSAGFGKAFIDAGNKEWGTGAMQHDISDGVRYLINEGIADPERIGIMGGSYGGYATLAGVAFTPELYAAGVSIVGPSNIITLLESIPPYWEAGRRMFAERVGDMDDPEERAMLEGQSPLNSADRIEDPLLVIQGANDPRVKQRESDQIVVALRERGFPVEYIVAPDEGHGFSGKENRLAMFAAIERFLGEHLGGRYQADVPAEIQQKLDAITVDPATVTITEPMDTAGMETLSFDGTAVRPMTMRYDIVFDVQGQQISLEDVSRAVLVTEHDGQPTYSIVDRATLPPMMGGVAVLDSFVVAQGELTPLYRKMQQGPGTIELTYAADQITGEMSQSGMSMPINVALDAPVLADNQAFEIGLSTLPLEEGYTAAYKTFNPSPSDQGIKEYVLTVTGTEEVTVPAGTFATFVVEVDMVDSNEDATLYISQEDGMLVKSLSTLPAAMGGGTVRAELLDVDTTGTMGG
ncbi:MAG: prolyl oligopeptidase family serine peptidase, partial [Rhodothermales bacterium]|nr:prolyl oligopeptidase family serine peptidase [Rhodothermales bacterium]